MKSVFCAGLDLSWTGTGVCVYDGEEVLLETISTKPKDFANEFERLRHISDTIIKTIGGYGIPALIAVEDFYTPHSSAQMGAAIKLVQLGTVVRMDLYEAALPFIIPTAPQLKKFATGAGNAEKSQILKAVFKRWGVDAKDDNQADAFVLARIAWGLLEKDSGNAPLKHEQEILTKVAAERPRFHF